MAKKLKNKQIPIIKPRVEPATTEQIIVVKTDSRFPTWMSDFKVQAVVISKKDVKQPMYQETVIGFE